MVSHELETVWNPCWGCCQHWQFKTKVRWEKERNISSYNDHFKQSCSSSCSSSHSSSKVHSLHSLNRSSVSVIKYVFYYMQVISIVKQTKLQGHIHAVCYFWGLMDAATRIPNVSKTNRDRVWESYWYVWVGFMTKFKHYHFPPKMSGLMW